MFVSSWQLTATAADLPVVAGMSLQGCNLQPAKGCFPIVQFNPSYKERMICIIVLPSCRLHVQTSLCWYWHEQGKAGAQCRARKIKLRVRIDATAESQVSTKLSLKLGRQLRWRWRLTRV